MLFLIASILFVLWVFGTISAYTVGGYIHLLLLFSIVIVLVRLIRGEHTRS